MNNTLHQFYTDKVAALTTEIAELKCHNTTFVLAELAAFVAMLASLVAYTLTSIGVLFIILGLTSMVTSPASMQERSISTRDTRLRSTWIYSVLNLSLTA